MWYVVHDVLLSASFLLQCVLQRIHFVRLHAPAYLARAPQGVECQAEQATGGDNPVNDDAHRGLVDAIDDNVLDYVALTVKTVAEQQQYYSVDSDGTMQLYWCIGDDFDYADAHQNFASLDKLIHCAYATHTLRDGICLFTHACFYCNDLRVHSCAFTMRMSFYFFRFDTHPLTPLRRCQLEHVRAQDQRVLQHARGLYDVQVGSRDAPPTQDGGRLSLCAVELRGVGRVLHLTPCTKGLRSCELGVFSSCEADAGVGCAATAEHRVDEPALLAGGEWRGMIRRSLPSFMRVRMRICKALAISEYILGMGIMIMAINYVHIYVLEYLRKIIPSAPMVSQSALGVAQHHDAISGTSKQEIAYEYARRIQQGRDVAGTAMNIWISTLLQLNATTAPPSGWAGESGGTPASYLLFQCIINDHGTARLHLH